MVQATALKPTPVVLPTGFSQGAALASLLLARVQQQQTDPKIKFAILVGPAACCEYCDALVVVVSWWYDALDQKVYACNVASRQEPFCRGTPSMLG